MTKYQGQKQPSSLYQRYKALSASKRVILVVFIIWFIQAVPKWSAAILADDELSSKIMEVFITPRGSM